MKHIRHYALALCLLSGLLLLLCTGTTFAQKGASTEGKEFWVVFQKNFRDFTTDKDKASLIPAKPLTIELFITSGSGAKGTIEIAGLSKTIPFTVAAGEVLALPIDTAAQLRSDETPDKLSIHIVADGPVTVYGLSSRYQTTDTYLAYPVNALGNSYRTMCYGWLENDLLSQFAVISTADSTTVRITPSCKTMKGKPAGVPFEVILNKGEVYQVIPRFDPNGTSDLTGSLIESNKPVAVFSGHNCAYVPDLRTKACNHLVEQMPPIHSWGKQFFVGTLSGRSASVLRVLANFNNTSVFMNNKLVATLNAGEYYEEKNQSQSTMVTSDHPVLVAQYSKGYENGDNVGDPMMIVIAPTEQFLSTYRFATPIQGQWHHYVNIVVPNTATDAVRLDNIPVNPALFRQFGISAYSIAQIEIPYGTHTLSCRQPFGLYSYGFGFGDASFDAYGNGGGQSLETVVEKPDTLAPTLSANLRLGKVITITAYDDRVNDLGVAQITPLSYENMTPPTPNFSPGAPQVQFSTNLLEAKHNSYAQFRLKDKAGNTSYYTVCIRRDFSLPDSLSVNVLSGKDAMCDFPADLQISPYIKYMVLTNNVTLAPGSVRLSNPVQLIGNAGTSTGGLGVALELPQHGGLSAIARIGIDVLTADVAGHYPDSLRKRASDSSLINEEFNLHRTSVMFTVAPGLLYYFHNRNAYVFGQVNLSLPIHTSELYTRTILSPSNYVYPNGEGTQTDYEGGDPSGVSILIAPELGIGSAIDLRNNWRLFGEIGIGSSLTSISANRDWGIQYWFSRMGARIRW